MVTGIFRKRWKYGKRRKIAGGKAPTYTANVTLTGSSSTLSTTLETTRPTYTATVTLSGKASTFSASGTTVVPSFTATVALVSQPTVLAALVSVATAVFLVNVSLVSSSTVLAASSQFAITYTATVSLTSTSSLLSASVTSTSVGPAPDTPVLTVVDNGDLTATLTVSDSSPGAANAIYILGPSSVSWVLVGSITGNGSIVSGALVGGQYFGYIVSTEHTATVVSLVVPFQITDNNDSVELIHSPADIIRYLLISQGKGSEPSDDLDWPMFTSSEPTIPDNCITTYDTSGVLQGRIQYSGEMVEHYGFQIRVRGSDHNTAWRKMNDIKTQMDQGVRLDTVNINSSIYLVEAITRSGGILALGKESPTSQRLVFTLNAIVALRQLA